jgi:hypothetical protein
MQLIKNTTHTHMHGAHDKINNGAHDTKGKKN